MLSNAINDNSYFILTLILKYLFQVASLEQYAIRSFADALEKIPLSLAENSGLAPIATLADIKSCQVLENNPNLGVDCMLVGTNG